MNVIELGIFGSRIESVCDEMGAVLKRASFSPNIKDRLDFSCAVFDAEGDLCAQAAHIPVHLGSMAYAMKDIVTGIDWLPGDMLVLNDPFLGGTHLPDVTVIAPVFYNSQLLAFVANRAHHANIGATAPGSMPLSSTLEEEGVIISPIKLVEQGERVDAVMSQLCAGRDDDPRVAGDFSAQISANRVGVERMNVLISSMDESGFISSLQALNDYGERIARAEIVRIPDGRYQFEDFMDDDGLGNTYIKIHICITVQQGAVDVDFTGTAPQVAGNINCPLSVAAAAVYYVFRCLMPAYAPACAGLFRPIELHAAEGCLVNARRPAAVAAGNVETSTRITDVVIGALAQAIPDRMPAASHGSMNNLAMGAAGANSTGKSNRNTAESWDYYETIGGGMGASVGHRGLSSVQTHMTNTLNTPIEVLETNYPVKVTRYACRQGSGGKGEFAGGDGIVREFQFLDKASVTLLTERRVLKPWGLAGGGEGAAGQNLLNGQLLPGKCQLEVEPGDILTIETPGGGGYGRFTDEECANE